MHALGFVKLPTSSAEKAKNTAEQLQTARNTSLLPSPA